MKMIILSAAMLLAACGQAPSTAAPQQKAIPMDGKVHVLEQKGKFAVTPTTLFCVNEPDYQSDISKLANNLPLIDHILMDILSKHLANNGQYIDANGDRHGRIYFGELRDKYCPDNGRNIILHQSLTMNAAGKPYRIEMSARQGVAVVRVGVERDRRRPDSTVPEHPPSFGDGPCCEPANSIQIDATEISHHLTNSIFKGTSK